MVDFAIGLLVGACGVGLGACHIVSLMLRLMERREEPRKENGVDVPDASKFSFIIGSVVALASGDVGAEIPCGCGEDVAVVHVVAAYGGLISMGDLIYIVVEGRNSGESPVVGALVEER